ncbi:phospholipase D-like domain-containing protein [Polyangium fumosum]|nr:phospholipase D-like domain-containing protein [Polyangium fumosum]
MGAAAARVLGDAKEFGKSLIEDLKAARSMSVAVAFAKESALEAVDVEGFCRTGRSLKLLAGTDFALTELTLLRRLGRTERADCRVYHSIGRNRVFHPKLYVLDKDASRVVYVGSSNFTFGGLAGNIEANVRLEGPADAPEIRDATDLFRALFDSEFATALSDDFEQRYQELQRNLRAVQRYPTVVENAQQMVVAESLLVGAYRAQKSNQRWLLVVSPENFATCMQHGVWGRMREQEIRAYSRGDVFFMHVTGGRGLAAFGMFVEEPYHDDTPLWSSDPRGVFPWRVKIHPFAVLTGGLTTKQVLAPLRAGARPNWFHGFIQQSHTLQDQDFAALKGAFEVAARTQIVAPG